MSRIPTSTPNHFRTGVLGIVAVAVLCLLIVTGGRIGGVGVTGGGRELHAIFDGTLGMRVGSPVRVAGVRIGRVDAIDAGPARTARVTLRLDGNAPVLRQGTRLRIRPRVFLEGGYVVEVEPGPPGRPALADGATVARADTRLTVPLPTVVGLLDHQARAGVRSTARELDRALATSGDARPLVRDLPPVLRDAGRLSAAARGTRPGEVGDLLAAADRATAALAAHRDGLASTLRGVRRVTGTLADEDAALGASLRELGALGRSAPGALREVRATLPVLEATLDDLDPALRRAPALLRPAERTLDQALRAVGPRELGALSTALRPVLGTLPTTLDDARATLDQATPLVRCLRDTLIPAFDEQVPDGDLSTGRSVLQELVSTGVGLASAVQQFDANGPMVRTNVTLGPRIFTTGSASGVGPLSASVGPPIEGARPVWYGTDGQPPFRPDLPCAEQPRPSLRSATASAGRTRDAPAAARAARSLLRSGARPQDLRREAQAAAARLRTLLGEGEDR